MGLFGKSKKEKMISDQDVPSLPELPKLPDFPHIDNPDYSNEEDSRQIHKLPSFPQNSLGSKFSQNTIKEAVTGEEEGFEKGYADDFDMDEDEVRMMQEPLKKPMTEEIGMQRNNRRNLAGDVTEPVFIRIDKFEDALRFFNESKRKILEIERLLNEIKRVREKEETELRSWEGEIKSLREKMEKVDMDLFSKA